VGTSACAQTSVVLQHDRDIGHETKVSVAQKTSIGTFDAGLFAIRGAGAANGYDLGYRHGVQYGRLTLSARAGFGRLNVIDINGGSFISNTNYLSATADARLAVFDEFGIYVNARHRNPTGDGANQNRFQAGVDMQVTEGIGARIGASHARQAGRSGTGLTAAINYTF
jgi:hypothetical protein